MADSTTPDELRAEALRQAAVQIAGSILSEYEPDPEQFGLLCLAAADAIVAGDRPLLLVEAQVCQRLIAWLPDCVPWRDDWAGRLSALQLIADFAWLQLEGEAVASDAPPPSG